MEWLEKMHGPNLKKEAQDVSNIYFDYIHQQGQEVSDVERAYIRSVAENCLKTVFFGLNMARDLERLQQRLEEIEKFVQAESVELKETDDQQIDRYLASNIITNFVQQSDIPLLGRRFPIDDLTELNDFLRYLGFNVIVMGNKQNGFSLEK